MLMQYLEITFIRKFLLLDSFPPRVNTNGHTKSSLRQQKDVFNHFKACAAVLMDGLNCILVSRAVSCVGVC